MKNGKQIAVAACAASWIWAAMAMAAPPPQEDPGGQLASPLISPEPPALEDRSPGKVELGEGFQAVEARRIVADLSPDATAGEVELALYELMPQIYQATRRDLPVIGEVLAGLRHQPGAVAALASQYQQLPAEAFDQRLIVLGMLGELRRADALLRLSEVVWAPLPAEETHAEALSARDVEEMIQAKAIQGMAYLATPEADAAVREVILHHEALHVRVSAIDAYMWNHGDSPETAGELYGLLAPEMHPYVERPRFHSGMDPEEFSKRLGNWRKKWSVEPAPVHDAEHEGESK